MSIAKSDCENYLIEDYALKVFTGGVIPRDDDNRKYSTSRWIAYPLFLQQKEVLA